MRGANIVELDPRPWLTPRTWQMSPRIQSNEIEQLQISKLLFFGSSFLLIRSQSPQSCNFSKLSEIGRYTCEKCKQVQKDRLTFPLLISSIFIPTFTQFSLKEWQFDPMFTLSFCLYFFMDIYQSLEEKYFRAWFCLVFSHKVGF